VSVQRPAFSALRIAISANIQQTATLYCGQHHFSRDLPLWPFVLRSRQCLNIIARIAQGAEHTAIWQRDRNMEGARPGHQR